MTDTRICPKCGNAANTYRHPFSKVWCPKCGFVLREEGEKEGKELHVSHLGRTQAKPAQVK